MPRRFLVAAAALLALVLPAPASAIVNGDTALQGEFPAQGVLRIDTDDTTPGFETFCGGTLIGSRQFLTAARCTRDDFGAELPVGNFLVQLGSIDRSAPDPDAYTVTKIDVAPDFSFAARRNDAAVLTLNRVANYDPMRVVDKTETGLWAPGTPARVLGWGLTSYPPGTRSRFLRKVDVPIIDDGRCAGAYPTTFDFHVMVCAADALGTPTPAHDSCVDDWGGPLLVPDGGGFALAGIVSTRGGSCGDPAQPGIYTRMGDDPLNQWVHDRTPEADFTFDHAPRAGEPVTLTSISRHPEGAGYFDTFRWDFDADGTFDAAGKSVTHTFPDAGEQVVGLEASRAGGDKATAYFAFDVEPAPTGGDGGGGTTPPPVLTPVVTPPVAKSPARATISGAKRPKVKRGRFHLSIRFGPTAPRGTAVIEVFRGKRQIGIARTRVKRGAAKRVTVKLTPTGKRLLSRSKTKRLKVRTRVRVGKTVLRSRTLSIRR
jgi:Trypsin/PKD domain